MNRLSKQREINARIQTAAIMRRQRAEALVREASQKNLETLSPQETQQMLHELHVHQIELEMQNEELRRSQLELENSRARYFDLYELAPVGYCTLSMQGIILQANLTAATLLNVARRGLANQPLSKFILKQDQDIYYLCRKQLLSTSEPQSCELRMSKPDGSHVWVHLSAAAVRHGLDVPVLRVILADITERVLSQQKNRQNEQRYHSLFNSIDDGFCIIEMIFNEHHKPVDYRFLEVNPSFEKQCGLYHATGRRVLELSPQLDPFWLEVYGKVATTGESTRFEREDKVMGRWFDVYALRVEEPEHHKVAVLFSDISERKHFEAELRRAKSLAERANTAKSAFLSNMSHELRTPLSAILGFAQLIEASSPPPTASQKASLSHIQNAGWHLLALINEILDLALVESGKLSIQMETVSVNEILQESYAMVEPQAQSRSIRVTLPPQETSHVVEADRIRLKQILINLLSNAIKYNKTEGSIMVKYDTGIQGKLRVSVTDTGKGLSPDELRQLFQPFNRLGQERGVEEGTGIGLVLCKRFIELMGGIIGVESTVDEGSTFWFQLNLTKDLNEQREREREVAPINAFASAPALRASTSSAQKAKNS